MRLPASLALASLLALPAFGQEGEATVIGTEESPDHGTYLTDALGQAVYLFSADKEGEADAAEISCTDAVCIGAWPNVTTSAAPEAAGQAQPDLLGTTEFEGQTVVTYNGWPLYYHNADEGEAGPRGHGIESFGGSWSLVTPAGEAVAD